MLLALAVNCHLQEIDNNNGDLTCIQQKKKNPFKTNRFYWPIRIMSLKSDLTSDTITDTSELLSISTQILSIIKTENYKKLASFIHPQLGIRFVPYTYIDTTESIVLTSKEFTRIIVQNKRIDWKSNWDPDMELELLTVKEFFKKFVYDADFLKAPVISINKFHNPATDLNNIEEIYPNCDVVECYFPGFDEKLDGMDFKILRLVFGTYKKDHFLVAIVHSEWTP